MTNTPFRKKSMERVLSPEQLNDYIRVPNPSVWIILAAVTVFLAGFGVWCFMGTLETKVDAVAVVSGSSAVCYVGGEAADRLSPGQTVRIGGTEGKVVSVPSHPTEITDDFDSYAAHLGNINAGDWYYPVVINISLADGAYNAAVITDSVHPLSFILN
ncbi:hypothetical protein FACS189499_09050 [Clostridia bacterium]|nr:hypothetical protein FACS189499_09050 [Clostridia bacterium]